MKILDEIYVTIPEAEKIAEAVNGDTTQIYEQYGWENPPEITQVLVYKVFIHATKLGFVKIQRRNPTPNAPDQPPAEGNAAELSDDDIDAIGQHVMETAGR